MNRINHSEQLNAIRSKYGNRYHHELEAHREAAALWGADANSCGVLPATHNETVLDAGSNKAEIRFCQTSKGYWLFGISCQTNISGHGYAPSAWDSVGFTSLEAARIEAMRRICRFFDHERRPDVKSAAEVLRAKLQSLVEQPSLFDFLGFSPLTFLM